MRTTLLFLIHLAAVSDVRSVWNSLEFLEGAREAVYSALETSASMSSFLLGTVGEKVPAGSKEYRALAGLVERLLVIESEIRIRTGMPHIVDPYITGHLQDVMTHLRLMQSTVERYLRPGTEVTASEVEMLRGLCMKSDTSPTMLMGRLGTYISGCGKAMFTDEEAEVYLSLRRKYFEFSMKLSSTLDYDFHENLMRIFYTTKPSEYRDGENRTKKWLDAIESSTQSELMGRAKGPVLHNCVLSLLLRSKGYAPNSAIQHARLLTELAHALGVIVGACGPVFNANPIFEREDRDEFMIEVHDFFIIINNTLFGLFEESWSRKIQSLRVEELVAEYPNANSSALARILRNGLSKIGHPNKAHEFIVTYWKYYDSDYNTYCDPADCEMHRDVNGFTIIHSRHNRSDTLNAHNRLAEYVKSINQTVLAIADKYYNIDTVSQMVEHIKREKKLDITKQKAYGTLFIIRRYASRNAGCPVEYDLLTDSGNLKYPYFERKYPYIDYYYEGLTILRKCENWRFLFLL